MDGVAAGAGPGPIGFVPWAVIIGLVAVGFVAWEVLTGPGPIRFVAWGVVTAAAVYFAAAEARYSSLGWI